MVVGGVAGRVGFLLGVQRHRRSAGAASSGRGGRDDLTSRGNASRVQSHPSALTPPAFAHDLSRGDFLQQQPQGAANGDLVICDDRSHLSVCHTAASIVPVWAGCDGQLACPWVAR